MQQYIIKSLRRISDNAIFERQETGTYSGGYVFHNEVKRLRDFLCDGNFKLHSVIRQGLPDVVFMVGERLANNRGIITSIKIVNSEVILLTGDATLDINGIRLIDAVKYVEPTVTRNPVGRPRANTTTQQVSPFDIIKQTIETNNPREVRVLGVLRNRRENLKEFLVKFFTEFNPEKETIFTDNRSIQTNAGKRRSLGDIYMICKYYYPNLTIKELIQLLYIDLFEEIDGFRSSYCNTIHKRVWYYSEGSENGTFDKTTNDEYNKPHRFYIDNLN
jgi:hypothetical protein